MLTDDLTRNQDNNDKPEYQHQQEAKREPRGSPGTTHPRWPIRTLSVSLDTCGKLSSTWPVEATIANPRSWEPLFEFDRAYAYLCTRVEYDRLQATLLQTNRGNRIHGECSRAIIRAHCLSPSGELI